jgi:phosphonopyruvate decarboxylase
MMKREDCFRILARHITDQDVVIATYSSAVEWIDLGPRTLNYLSIGAMGLASSHALGLALTNPDKRIIVLDGDGSLLMNLGSLVTIGAQAPKNLIHFVSNNGCYEANGSHPIPNPKVDFTGLARSAGYAKAYDFSELPSFEQQIANVLDEQGPVFGTLHIARTRPLSYDYPALYAAEKRRALKAELKRTAP